jgi:hypothetical protein
MTTEELYAIPVNGDGWRILPNGNGVTLGDGVTLGNYVTLGNDVKLGYGVKLGFTPLAVQGSRHLAGIYEPGFLQIGCHKHPIAQWLSHGESIGKVEGYTPEQVEEYRKIIDFLISMQPAEVGK